CRLRDLGLPQNLGVGRDAVAAENQVAQVAPEHAAQDLRASVDVSAKDRLVAIERARHSRMLRSLPGEHEGYSRRPGRRLAGGDPLRILRAKRTSYLGRAFSDHRAAVRKIGAPAMQRECHVCESDARLALEMGSQSLARLGKRGLAPRGQEHELEGS